MASLLSSIGHPGKSSKMKFLFVALGALVATIAPTALAVPKTWEVCTRVMVYLTRKCMNVSVVTVACFACRSPSLSLLNGTSSTPKET